jgi:hypothetical protein
MISTRRIFSDTNKSINLETLMEKVDKYLNSILTEGFEVISVSYVSVENIFCTVITLRTIK